MFDNVSTSELLTYVSILVLAVAFIVLVLWVARISSKMASLKQALMITERKLEDLQREIGIGVYGAVGRDSGREAAYEPDVMNGSTKTSALQKSHANGNLTGSTGQIDMQDIADDGEIIEDAEVLEHSFAGTADTPRARRQQEQMERIHRARQRQEKLRQKHAEEVAEEQQHKREIARMRDEQIRSFQEQQARLRHQMQRERERHAAEEERQAKLRTRASWPSERERRDGHYVPRQVRANQRLEQRRHERLRRQAEEIISSRFSDM